MEARATIDEAGAQTWMTLMQRQADKYDEARRALIVTVRAARERGFSWRECARATRMPERTLGNMCATREPWKCDGQLTLGVG